MLHLRTSCILKYRICGSFRGSNFPRKFEKVTHYSMVQVDINLYLQTATNSNNHDTYREFSTKLFTLRFSYVLLRRYYCLLRLYTFYCFCHIFVINKQQQQQQIIAVLFRTVSQGSWEPLGGSRVPRVSSQKVRRVREG